MKVKVGQWQTRDGSIVQISDMDDDHLMNAIKMCVQNAPKIRRLLTQYLESLSWSALNYSCSHDTPDGASMAADWEADRLLGLALEIQTSDDIIITSKAAELIREAYARGLKPGVPGYKILESFI
jgi:hypothetical protein